MNRLFLFLLLATSLFAGSATNIGGLYYTGLDSTGSLQTGGGRDANWDVTYAFVNGVRYRNSSTYTSPSGAYVLSSAYIDSAYVPNTGSAQWITAPGALTTATGTANVGGDFLPGNGTTGTNTAFYVYQLAFNVYGTGSGVVTNSVEISLTVAADDQYSIYVTSTPVTVSSSGAINASYGPSASRLSAWNNTFTETLANGVNGNTTFSIGTNYITVIVQNTNSQIGQSSTTTLNPSGLLVYQVGSVAIIDGHAVPEVYTFLPILAAISLILFRRKK
jgi:hypothetical protein